MITDIVGFGQPRAFYRVISPLYAHMPKSGAGAARHGGRFNRPGQEALYLSASGPVALAEYQQDNSWLAPGTICTFFVSQILVADFSAGFDPASWPPLWADYDVDWRTEWFNKKVEPPSWYMADDVVAAKLEGILFPSQALPGGTNLVLYGSSHLSHQELRVFDPKDDLGALAKRARGTP